MILSVGVDYLSEMLLNRIVTGHQSNHLRQATFSVNWYSWSLLFNCLPGFIFGIPFLSSLAVPILWRPFSKSLMIKNGLKPVIVLKPIILVYSSGTASCLIHQRWVESLETQAEKLSSKWLITDLIFRPCLIFYPFGHPQNASFAIFVQI